MRLVVPTDKRLTLRHTDLPPLTHGLRFASPAAVDAKYIYGAGGGVDATPPSDEAVDEDGTFLHYRTGLITQATADQMRMACLTTDNPSWGWLIESASENLCLNSEVFRAAISAWLASNSAITDNAAVAPDGNATADLLAEDNVNTSHFQRQGISFTNGTTYTFSLFAKASTRGEIRMDLSTAAFPANTNSFFNLATGAVGTLGAGADSATIDDMGNGWYRCAITAEADATIASNAQIVLSVGGETIGYLGDGSSGVFIWGAQVEAQAFASSYIPTTTVSVARAADRLIHPNANDENCAPAQGTIYAAYTPLQDGVDIANAASYVLDTRDVAIVDGVCIYSSVGSGKFGVQVRSGGGTSASIAGTTAIVRGMTYILALVWAIDDFRFYLNGAEEGTPVTSGAAPTAMSNISIGAHASGSYGCSAIISRILSYGSIHTEEQVGTVTNWVSKKLGLS